MDDLRTRILTALHNVYLEDPNRYTFVSTLLSEFGIPYDIEVGEVFIALQRDGFIDVMSTTNIRVRLTDSGAKAAG